MEMLSGFLVLDKPCGITSRAALDRAAPWFPRGTRLGHTGTLDPLATGVLVVAVGQGTRLAEYVQLMDKTYRAGIRLGSRSTTDDAEGTITPTQGASAPAPDVVERALAAFLGDIAQVPPAYSAAKVAGRRAYDLARRGKQVELTPRTVRIYDLALTRYAYPDLDVTVRCGKGTYIRALARDLGEQLGCGAFLYELRRTRVGPFTESMAVTLETDPGAARQTLRDLSWAVADMPRVQLDAADADRFRHGQPLQLPGATSEGSVGVFEEAGPFVGVGRLKASRLSPEKVVN